MLLRIRGSIGTMFKGTVTEGVWKGWCTNTDHRKGQRDQVKENARCCECDKFIKEAMSPEGVCVEEPNAGSGTSSENLSEKQKVKATATSLLSRVRKLEAEQKAEQNHRQEAGQSPPERQRSAQAGERYGEAPKEMEPTTFANLEEAMHALMEDLRTAGWPSEPQA